MSAHTPGPWHRNIPAEGKYPTVFAGRNQHVAVASQQKDSAETEANISLIAAAPDLLAALQRATALLARYPDHTDAWRDCRSAIAKATGDTA
jgi:histidinol-phosphate/aromatic aminotransferase/cobyric acid decarboxylase-like protein